MPKPVKWKYDNPSSFSSKTAQSIIDTMAEKPFSVISKNIVISDANNNSYEVKKIKIGLMKATQKIYINLLLEEGEVKLFFPVEILNCDLIIKDALITFASLDKLMQNSFCTFNRPIPVLVEVSEDGLKTIEKLIKKESRTFYKEVLDW